MIVELNNLQFYAYHGLYDFEREKGGEFIVNVKIESTDNMEYTNLSDVVNYEDVYRIVNHQMVSSKDFIEEVARLILEDLKIQFTNAIYLEVKLTKCAPPIQGMKGAATVTSQYRRL
jgi:dihydroneopterin aldolase